VNSAGATPPVAFQIGADAHLQGLADIPVGHGVYTPGHGGVAIPADLGLLPGDHFPGLVRKQQKMVFLLLGEVFQGPLPGGAVDAPAGYLETPPDGFLAGLLQASELPTPPEAVPDVRHNPFNPRIVFRVAAPARVNQGVIVSGQLRIDAVELRIVDIRLDHAVPEVVQHQATRHTPEEFEGKHVAFQPRLKVQAQHRTDEHVAAEGQHHRKGPDSAPPAGRRFQPLSQVTEVDLGLRARRNLRPPDGDLRLGQDFRQHGPDVAAEAR